MTMIALALLGVVTVFHEFVGGLLAPGPSTETTSSSDEGSRRP